MDCLDEKPNLKIDEISNQELIETEDNSLIPFEHSNIRSSAVVTYSKSKFPNFLKLSPQTNLNLAPSNWLRSGYGIRTSFKFPNLQNPCFKNQLFPSFSIAENHLNDLDDIDVISDAENIKKLLKVPYSSSQVSMAIHPVGRTLLVEELNSTNTFELNSEQWKWFEIISKQLLGKKYEEKRNQIEGSHQDYRRMLSKFLYYSIEDSSNTTDSSSDDFTEDIAKISDDRKELVVGKTNNRKLTKKNSETISNLEGIPKGSELIKSETQWKFWTPSQPLNPTFDNEEVNQSLKDSFERTIKWKFEDLQMVLGSNLPIFGRGEYPAVTLRLRDSNQAINVLTGLDYWLDNLICNVPEVIMCFHLNGIVQNYEVIKTEDIPQLQGSRFNPGVVKDIAKNILSFLKTNCTKEGHTYWLFKGDNDDVVKLYDLTMLSRENVGCENPFKIPVASLLYKMAVNLIHQQEIQKNEKTVRKLLLNCVQILDYSNDDFLAPLMLSSALYILSSLAFADPSTTTRSCDAKTKEDDYVTSHPQNSSMTSLPNDDDVMTAETRNCEIATILSVQDLMRRNENVTAEMTSSTDPEDTYDEKNEVAMKHAQRAWEVFCSCSGKQKSSSSVDLCLQMLPVHRRTVQNTVFIYHQMAQDSYHQNQFGRAMAYIYLALNNQEYLDGFPESTNEKSSKDADISSLLPEDDDVIAQLMSLAGGLHMAILESKEFEKHNSEYWRVVLNEERRNMKNLSLLFTSAKKFSFLTELNEGGDCRKSLETSYKCFINSLNRSRINFKCQQWPPSSINLLKITLSQQKLIKKRLDDVRKLGYVANELGKLDLNKIKSSDDEVDENLRKSSFNYFQHSYMCFFQAGDVINQGLVLSNIAQVTRKCAEAMTSSQVELFQLAIDYYDQAISIFKKFNLQTLHDLYWQLNTTNYHFAIRLMTRMMSQPVESQMRIEKKVSDLLNKSLKICSLIEELKGTTEESLKCRQSYHVLLATINNQLFKIEFRDRSRQNRLFNIAQLHYSKYLQLEKDSFEKIRVQIYCFELFQLKLDYLNRSKNLKDIDLLEGIKEMTKIKDILHEVLPYLQKDLSKDFTDSLSNIFNLISSHFAYVIKVTSSTPELLNKKSILIFRDFYVQVLRMIQNRKEKSVLQQTEFLVEFISKIRCQLLR